LHDNDEPHKGVSANGSPISASARARDPHRHRQTDGGIPVDCRDVTAMPHAAQIPRQILGTMGILSAKPGYETSTMYNAPARWRRSNLWHQELEQARFNTFLS